MSAGGHISDMMNRIKQNALLKNARRRKFKGGNDYSKIKNIKTEYDFPKLSKLKLFKKRIREEAKQEKRKRTTLIILCVLILFIALFVFNHY